MLKRNFVLTFTALVLIFSGTSLAAQTAQPGLSYGPEARPFGEGGDTFFDEELYDYDAQLWAPYDITAPNGEANMQSGYYARLGFAYLSLSGPGPQANQDPRQFESVVNWTWGRDVEFGFVDQKKKGWSVSWYDYNASDYLRDTEFTFTAASGGFQNPMLLRTRYNNIAIRRQFRQALSTGGYIEPYFGIQYMSLIDETNEDWTIPDPISPLVPTTQRRFNQKTTNSMGGGQVGTRYFKQNGRYKVSSSVAVGANYNSQVYSANSVTGIIPNGEPGYTFTNRGNDFVPFFDLGVELNYMLTRDISFRVGAKLNWNWQGIARVDTRGLEDNPYSLFAAIPGLADPGIRPDTSLIPTSITTTEDLIVGGFTFGIDWKR